MSYIFFALQKDRGIYLFGDKRRSKFDNGIMVPVADDEQKVFKINRNLLIGFAGSLWYPERLVSFVKACCKAENDNYLGVARRMATEFKLHEENYGKLTYVIAGYSEDGYPGFAKVDGYDDYKVTSFSTGSECPNCFGEFGAPCHEEGFFEAVGTILTEAEHEDFEEKLIRKVEEHFKYVSEHQPSVSEDGDLIVLERPL